MPPPPRRLKLPPVASRPSGKLLTQDLADTPETASSETIEVMARQKRHRRRWALMWAIAIHTAVVIITSLSYLAPAFIAQIGNSVSLSTEPATDFEEDVEKPTEEEMIITSQEAPPPKPVEAAIPDLEPILTVPDLVFPEPNESPENLELESEIADLGVTFGEGFEDDLEEEVRETQMFSAPAKGNCTIFVIDVSTSMPREIGLAGIDAMKKDLRRAINALPPDRLFNLICFGNRADGFAKRPVLASPDNKRLAHRFMVDYFTGKFTRTRTGNFGRRGVVNGVPYVPIEPNDVVYMKKTGGGSRYDLALVAAFQQRATTIYLITDGTPSTTRDRGLLPGMKALSRDEIIRTVIKAGKKLYKENSPIIHCVGINRRGEAYLKQIALAFGGAYRNIDAGR